MPPTSPPAPEAKITGRVVDERGEPLAGARVFTDPEPITDVGAPHTGPDGTFDLDRYNLEPGRYTVIAHLEGYIDGVAEVDATHEPVFVEIVLRRR